MWSSLPRLSILPIHMVMRLHCHENFPLCDLFIMSGHPKHWSHLDKKTKTVSSPLWPQSISVFTTSNWEQQFFPPVSLNCTLYLKPSDQSAVEDCFSIIWKINPHLFIDCVQICAHHRSTLYVYLIIVFLKRMMDTSSKWGECFQQGGCDIIDGKGEATEPKHQHFSLHVASGPEGPSPFLPQARGPCLWRTGS